MKKENKLKLIGESLVLSKTDLRVANTVIALYGELTLSLLEEIQILSAESYAMRKRIFEQDCIIAEYKTGKRIKKRI